MNQAKINKWICVISIITIIVFILYLKIINGAYISYLFVISLLFLLSCVIALPVKKFALRKKN